MALSEEVKQAGFKALRYLSYRDRSRKEMAEYLAKKGFSLGAIEKTLENLARLGYIDDERLALCWGRSRLESRKIGRRRLAQELFQRGLAKDLIDRALDQLFGEYEEWDLALASGEKKFATLKGNDREKTRRRLTDHLQRRGFAFDTVIKVVNKLAPYNSGGAKQPETEPPLEID